jgi:hypothetical protein
MGSLVLLALLASRVTPDPRVPAAILDPRVLGGIRVLVACRVLKVAQVFQALVGSTPKT